jgi:outer membrane protein assembly factor BamB
VGSCNGFFRALEKRTGLVRWSYDTSQDGMAVQFHSDPIVIEDLVVTGSDLVHGPARIYAFERATGKPRWKRELGSGAAADVVRVGTNVCAASFDDSLACLDWKTGEIAWRFEGGHPDPDLDRASGPAASEDRIFFGGAGGTVYALEAQTGVLVWKRELGGRVTTSVVLAGGSLYAGSSTGHLYRLDSKTGAVTADFTAEGVPTGRMLFAEDSLVVFFGDSKLSCFDPALKAARWSAAASDEWSSSKPYAWPHAVLAGNRSGELMALRLSDGSRLWSEKFDGVVRGIGFAENVFYVGTVGGTIYARTASSPPQR